ncbi:MAG: leucine-rich repeat domain-containing protein [Oscillospiraceae bacterium]|jgi:DNA-directed RNA polymerase subunit RPC12/RpoP|nr:leucine-rich repeat domain-containing protein [Oscillospiraceae bacterium]
MPFAAAKCTQCGADLQVDSAQEAAVCQFCGTAFVVEKAISHYQTTNHITAGVVNMIDSGARDFEICARVLLRYNGAATDIVIPDGVKEIGNKAFSGYKYLQNITFPEGLQIIGTEAFNGCVSITTISLPNSVTTIADNAFCGCSNLGSVTLSNNLTTIGGYAFYGCTNLCSIVFPESLLTIGGRAFQKCESLTSIIIPERTRFTGWGAFWNCKNLTVVKSRYLQQFFATPWGKAIENDLVAFLRSVLQERKKEKKCLYCGGKISLVLRSLSDPIEFYTEKRCKSCGFVKRDSDDYNARFTKLYSYPLPEYICAHVIGTQKHYDYGKSYGAFAKLIIDHLAAQGLQW